MGAMGNAGRACRAHGALLQPAGIPERVRSGTVDQAGTYRVGDDVGGQGPDILFSPDGMVMVGTRPDRAGLSARPVDLACACGLEPIDQRRKGIATQLQQPVRVIRHQYP